MNIIKYAKDKGADDVIVEKINSKTKQVRFFNNSISIFNDWKTTFYKVFLSWKRSTVSTIIFSLSENSLRRNIDGLIKSAKFLKPNENFYEIAKGPFEYREIPETYDKRIENIEETDMINSAINAALENSKTTAGSFYSSIMERDLQTSSDVQTNEKATSLQISIRAFNEDDESGHSVSCSRTLDSFDPKGAGREAGQISKLAKNPKSGISGKFDVLFGPMSIANLLGLVGSASSVFYVESGLSFLKDKIGKQVANNIVNIIDDGTIKNGYDSSKFDDEGVPVQKTEIIKNGTLQTYLHNTSSAKKYKTKTTGNAGLIAPHPINIILQEGNQTKEEIVKEMKSGIYITNLWYTRFQNYMSGDFSTIPRDGIFEIKNGEIIGSLKNIRITENLQRILMGTKKISNNPQWIQWWGMEGTGAPALTPTVLVEDVNITLPTM
jgi:PmbA protein